MKKCLPGVNSQMLKLCLPTGAVWTLEIDFCCWICCERGSLFIILVIVIIISSSIFVGIIIIKIVFILISIIIIIAVSWGLSKKHKGKQIKVVTENFVLFQYWFVQVLVVQDDAGVRVICCQGRWACFYIGLSRRATQTQMASKWTCV